MELSELVRKYAEIRNVLDPNKTSKNISESLNVQSSLSRRLKEKNIQKNLFSVASNTKITPEENYQKLIEAYPLEVLKENKDLCLQYIKFILTTGIYHQNRNAVINKIKRKISLKDPMLAIFLAYKFTEIKNRRSLEKHLVNETIESLETRYKDILDVLLKKEL